MNGTNFTRALRLASHLASKPLDIGRYVRHWPAWGKEPIDYALPWYSFSSIDFLERYLKKDMVIFEFGGGGSTLFYAQRAKEVICVESSHEWAEKISEKLKDHNITNVHLNVMPFEVNDKNAFLTSDYLNSVTKVKADVYVVDGYEDKVQLRPECFWLVEKQVKSGDIIVVDDSWRYESIRRNNKAKKWIEFKSVGPCRYGVTSTDIYFY